MNSVIKHRVTANLIVSKIPNCEISGIRFFKDPNFGCDQIPQISVTSNGEECEMEYKHVTGIRLRSPYYMSAEIETDNENKIEDIARSKFDHILNNLSFLLDEFWGEYKIVKVDTWLSGQWRTVHSISSVSARLPLSFTPSLLDFSSVTKLKKLIGVDDEIYKKSLHYLSAGEKRLNRDLIRGEDRIDPETFLNLFKPIELISNEICKSLDVKTVPKKLFFEFIVNWFILGQEKAVEKLISGYKKVKLHILSIRIQKTGAILKIEEKDIKNAIKFSELRSQLDIAHAHKKFPKDKVDYCELSKLARIFITQYLEYSKLC